MLVFGAGLQELDANSNALKKDALNCRAVKYAAHDPKCLDPTGDQIGWFTTYFIPGYARRQNLIRLFDSAHRAVEMLQTAARKYAYVDTAPCVMTAVGRFLISNVSSSLLIQTSVMMVIF